MYIHHFLERSKGIRGNWRFWIGWNYENKICFEMAWPSRSIGFGFKQHSHENGGTARFLWISLLFIQFFIPLGYGRKDYDFGDEPEYSFEITKETGLYLHWGLNYKILYWPFRTILLEWHYLSKDNEWKCMMEHDGFRKWKDFYDEKQRTAKKETYPYTYTLRSGEQQHVNATIVKHRRIKGRNLLHKIGWPKTTEYEIDITFDGEVGEEAGFWKGGCIGCMWTMLPGEQPVDTLRRMEKERKFE